MYGIPGVLFLHWQYYCTKSFQRACLYVVQPPKSGYTYFLMRPTQFLILDSHIFKYSLPYSSPVTFKKITIQPVGKAKIINKGGFWIHRKCFIHTVVPTTRGDTSTMRKKIAWSLLTKSPPLFATSSLRTSRSVKKQNYHSFGSKKQGQK